MLVMVDMFLYHRHLSATDTCTNITHTIVVANGRMLIVRISITRLRGIPHDGILVLHALTNQGATTRSRNHLVPVETQHTELTESAQYPSVKLRAKALGSILHYRNIVTVGNFHNPFAIVRHTVESHRNNRLWLLSYLGDTVFYRLLQQHRVHIPSFRLRTHKHRLGTQISDRMRRGTESKALYQHFISRTDTASYQCQMYCCRTRTQCHHFMCAARKLFQILLKSIYIRSQRYYPIGIKCLLHIFLFQSGFAHVGEAEINLLVHKIYIYDLQNYILDYFTSVSYR